MNTPIYNKLRELESEKRIPFHMPGHKRADFGAFFGVEKMEGVPLGFWYPFLRSVDREIRF